MERGDSEVLRMDWMNGDLPSGTYFFSVPTIILLIYHLKDTTRLGHSHYANNWTAPPAPPFPPPHQMSGAMHHTSDSESDPTLLQSHFTSSSIPLSHHQDTTLALSLPSDASDATSLLPDIDYFSLTEMGTTTCWDGIETSNFAILDNFEKTFGSYEYLQ